MAQRVLGYLTICFLLCSVAVSSSKPFTALQSSSAQQTAFEATKGVIKDEFVRVDIESIEVKSLEHRELLAEDITLTSSSSNFRAKVVNNYQSPNIIVAPNNWYHVVFENWTGSEWDIIYARSTDGGATWAYATLARAGDQRNPRIALTSDWKFHIVSEEPTYFVIWQSSNNGSSWSAAGYAGTEWWANAKYPSLASNGTWLYSAVEYWDGANWYIRVRYSSDSGYGWDTFTISVANGRYPSVAINSEKATVAFQLGAPTSTKLYLWNAALGSSSGSAVTGTANHRHPYLSISGTTALVAWTYPYTASDDDIGVKWSTNSGYDWSSSTRVVGTTFQERFPAIVARGTEAHLACGNASGNNTWYLYSSNPATVGFGGSEISTVASVANATYRFCDITVNISGGPNIVWTDRRDGGLDIYFCRYANENIRITGPAGPQPPPTHTYELTAGWNFISLPYSNSSITNASQLASAIGDNCTYIANRSGTAFQIYTKATGSDNFDLELGRGYNVYVTVPTTFTLSGEVITSATLTLTQSWNSIGWFNNTVITAEQLVTKIPNCAAVAYWDNGLGRFVTHPANTQVTDFNIEKGYGYLVYVTQETTWVNE